MCRGRFFHVPATADLPFLIGPPKSFTRRKFAGFKDHSLELQLLHYTALMSQSEERDEGALRKSSKRSSLISGQKQWRILNTSQCLYNDVEHIFSIHHILNSPVDFDRASMLTLQCVTLGMTWNRCHPGEKSNWGCSKRDQDREVLNKGRPPLRQLEQSPSGPVRPVHTCEVIGGQSCRHGRTASSNKIPGYLFWSAFCMDQCMQHH